MILFLSIIGIAIIIILIMLLAAVSSFDQNVKRLFLQSAPVGKRNFYPIDFVSLPDPVQHYFAHVLPDGQPSLSYVRLKHRGRFKTGIEKPWEIINGEEYFTIEKPGFLWKGKTKNFTAIDQYISGKGSLKVYLFSFLRITDGEGKKFSQGELLRWLGESVWFPTALLPNKNLSWEAIDSHHAKVVYRYKNLCVYYIVTFNEVFEIVQLETRRYMGGKELETWIGRLSNYKKFNNILIPATIQGSWKLAHAEFTYAVFYLTEIEYDQPEKFVN